MKKTIILLLLFLGTAAIAQAQKDCGSLVVNLDSCTVNHFLPDLPIDSLKLLFPCFSKEQDEDTDDNCGEGLIYDSLHFSVYTQRDFFEIREGFLGTINYSLFGKDEAALEKLFGEPVRVADIEQDEGVPPLSVYFYKKKNGFLLIWLNAEKKVFKIQMHAREQNMIELCY